MLRVRSFTFNPFQENTYVVDNGSEAIIIDPGCWNDEEFSQLDGYLKDNALRPSRLVLTHAHIDHILGNDRVYRAYGLKPWLHKLDLPILEMGQRTADLYQIPYDPSPDPEGFIKEGELISLGESTLEVRFVPGHAPGHVALYSKDDGFVISGDVLFQRSIGRTDLPGGDMNVLLESIKKQLFTLPENTVVYSGHGPSTTVGEEKRGNPFLNG